MSTMAGCISKYVMASMVSLSPGSLANNLLETKLLKHDYYECPLPPGLWRHKWRPVLFSLIFDDFGVEYVGKRHVDHLINYLK